MFDKEIDYNYATAINGVKVSYTSSTREGCLGSNIINNDNRTLWVSKKSVPQKITLNLTNMIKRPKNFFCEYFGVYCWHAYKTNPKLIELYYSENNKQYYFLGKFNLKLKPGIQTFKLDQNNFGNGCKSVNYIQIVIKSTYGGSRTYLNQIFFYDKTQNDSNLETPSNRNGTTNNFTSSYENGNQKKSPITKKEKKLKKILNTRNINRFIQREDNINDDMEKPHNDYYNRKIYPQLGVCPKLCDIISSPTSPDKFVSLSNFKTLSSTQKDYTYYSPQTHSNEMYTNLNYTENLENHLKDMETLIQSMKIENNLSNELLIQDLTQNQKSNAQIIVDDLRDENFENGEENNMENENDEKISSLEYKINNLQTDITDIKNTMNKIIEGVNQNEININKNLCNESFLEGNYI